MGMPPQRHKVYAMEKAYEEFIKDNGFVKDELQLNLLDKLSEFKLSIENEERSNSFLGRLFGKAAKADYTSVSSAKGIYIWGDVGRGKTAMMDLFFENLETESKRRIHFHEFMSEFHGLLKKWRDENSDEEAKDPIPKIIKKVSKKCAVLCFDELQVNNIADAMILGRIFEALIENGTFIAITSNRIPSDLFKDGLQRERFLPCISLIEKELEVFHLNNNQDYRMIKLADLQQVYQYPLGKDASKFIKDTVKLLTGHTKLESMDLKVNKRKKLRIKNYHGTVALFSFAELCEASLGAVDYLALCKNFRTIIIKDIPKLSSDNHNEALRFITLIDCMYESGTKLICTAAAESDKLYEEGKNNFEFHRTVSRLTEMQSKDYLERR